MERRCGRERERERESGITFSISGRAELSSDLSRCHSCWLSNLFGTEAFSPRFTSFPIPLYGESRERNNKAASLSDIALMHALPALSLSFSLYALYIYLLLFLNLRLNRRRLPFRIRGPPTALFFANISVGVWREHSLFAIGIFKEREKNLSSRKKSRVPWSNAEF